MSGRWLTLVLEGDGMHSLLTFYYRTGVAEGVGLGVLNSQSKLSPSIR